MFNDRPPFWHTLINTVAWAIMGWQVASWLLNETDISCEPPTKPMCVYIEGDK